MKHNQLKSLGLVVGFAVAMSQPLNAYRDDWHKDEVKPEEVLLGVIGTIAAGLGIYALGSCMEWWGTSTNEELIEQGRSCIAKASNYKDMYHVTERARFDNRVSEEALYEAALLKRSSSNINDYLSGMETCINNLNSIAKKIDRRIDDISRKGSSQDRYALSSMRPLYTDIRDVQHNMNVVHTYLKDNRAYFQLFETEDYMAQKYARELNILNQYAYDAYGLLPGLRSALSTRHSGAFGLLKAIKILQSDIATLKNALSKKAYMYVNRFQCARTLLNTLAHMQEIVISDPEYARLQLQYEAAEREKERLRLERERIANEKRIAAAKEREAYAKEQEARAKEREARAREEQNRLKAQENKLKEQELYDNRVQSYIYR